MLWGWHAHNGVSLGNDLECIPGTVGAIVMRNGTRYLLGPNHLLARRNAGQPGESIVQPARSNTTGIAFTGA